MTKYKNVTEYIEANWSRVVRECRKDKGELVGMPYPFTVPAVGRFESLYYWDTYFTNVGLILDGRASLAKNNTDNMLYLVDKFGFMPNSNARYHLDHSQPPFLSVMVRELYEYYSDRVWLMGAYEMLKKEYNYWMTERGTPIGLNRYDTNIDDREYLATRAPDYERRVQRRLSGDKTDIGRHYLATCESGYDCSTRFEFEIYNYAPVCLNSLMYAFEENMAYFATVLKKTKGETAAWRGHAETRRELMCKYMLDENGCFRDYNFVTKKKSKDFSSASVFPLFCGVADAENARCFVSCMSRLEAPYGILANEKNSISGNFQWGYPNGWACHQMMVVYALDKYGYAADARRIAEKYITVADRVFEKTQNLWEKYNVIDGNEKVEDEAQGGMPPMMGWTAGAYLYIKAYLNKQ